MSPNSSPPVSAPPEFDQLVEEARAEERAGQWGTARQRYKEALRTLSRPEHASMAASLLRWVGMTHRAEADAEAAMDCFEASLTIAELNGDEVNMARALNWIGSVHFDWGHLDTAEEVYLKAQVLAEGADEAALVGHLNANMGMILSVRGDVANALRHFQRALQCYREVGEQVQMGRVLNNLGMLHTDLQQWQEAEESLTEAAGISERFSDPVTRVMVETNLTELKILKGEYARARESCDIAFELASNLEHHLGLGEVYKNYGVIFRETGKYSLAETHLKSASEIAERYSNPLLAGEVQRELAQIYRLQDRNREALQALNYAHRVFSDMRASLDLADVSKRLGALEEIFLAVVRKWGESIESKDHYTAGHCERVADFSCMLARAVGFDEQTMKWFRMGAFLHDVGKTAVPAEILNKEGKLSPEEWDIMRQHTLMGVELLSSIEFPWDIRPMVRSHHERWDGTGYPDGLKSKSIPLSARILCVADVFDALTTTRSYRKAYAREQALEIMERDVSRIFDPELFGLFKQVVVNPQEERAVAAT